MHDEIEPIILPRLAQHFQNLNLDLQFVSMKLDRKHIMADLATQQLDFVIDLEQYLSPKLPLIIWSQMSSLFAANLKKSI